MNCREILEKAVELTSGERARTHGDKVENHTNIAQIWNAYLSPRIILSSLDVAILMALLKIARIKSGVHNVDNYIDLAGYAGVAGEIAEFKNDIACGADRLGEQRAERPIYPSPLRVEDGLEDLYSGRSSGEG